MKNATRTAWGQTTFSRPYLTIPKTIGVTAVQSSRVDLAVGRS